MAKKPQNLLKTVGDRILDAAQATFSGPDLPAEGYTDAEGRIIPPPNTPESVYDLPSDPFLPNWDPARRKGGLVNPTPEQRTMGLAEFIAKDVVAPVKTAGGSLFPVMKIQGKDYQRRIAQKLQAPGRKFR